VADGGGPQEDSLTLQQNDFVTGVYEGWKQDCRSRTRSCGKLIGLDGLVDAPAA
jgi:hypothetical protein